MNSPVAVLRSEETVERVMTVLDTIAHSGFPVVEEYDVDQLQQQQKQEQKQEEEETEDQKEEDESLV